MSSPETFKKTTPEVTSGLSDEQKAEVRRLKGVERQAENNFALWRGINNPDEPDFDPTDQVKLDEATDARIKHYEDNESAYQEQAVKDAAAEGVETDFGSEQKAA